MPKINKLQHRSADSLFRLYGFVIALAITEALKRAYGMAITPPSA